jgi:hypothetical protein
LTPEKSEITSGSYCCKFVIAVRKQFIKTFVFFHRFDSSLKVFFYETQNAILTFAYIAGWMMVVKINSISTEKTRHLRLFLNRQGNLGEVQFEELILKYLSQQ